MQDQTFFQSVSKVLLLSQIFALLPVSNISARNVQRIRYAWLSPRTVYSALILALNVFEFGAVMNLVLQQGLNFHHSGTLSLYVVCLLEHVYFWRLATKWPFIMRMWHQAEEQIFLRAPYRQYAATFNMKRRICGFAFGVMLCAFAEHALLMFNSFNKCNLEYTQCKPNKSYWEILYRRERYHLYIILPYRFWLLPLYEWINLTLAYPRAFTDAFILCISVGLMARFRQLYLRIEAVHTKAMPVLFWTEVRQHYLTLKLLIRILNAEINMLILLACANNMYFICFQLFNSFQNIGGDHIALLAFWYSLLFAIVRTILTLYVASTVDDYTRRILATLRNVPSRSWCMEIQRFSEQLAVDLTALSGNGFFFLTRRLILAMASTIVTYELMVTDVINKGSIKVQTDYCMEYRPSAEFEQTTTEWNPAVEDA